MEWKWKTLVEDGYKFSWSKLLVNSMRNDECFVCKICIGLPFPKPYEYRIECLLGLLDQQGKIFPQNDMKGKWKSFSHVRLFGSPWTVQSMEFSRPEYWSGQPFPSPEDLPNPGIEPRSPALQADSLPAEPQRKPNLG